MVAKAGQPRLVTDTHHDEGEEGRFNTMMESLAPLAPLFRGKHVLDYGCSWGTSARALIHLGAARVDGVEIDADRVNEGLKLTQSLLDRVSLQHVPDTRRLPFGDGAFEFVLAQAVFEHIPGALRPAHFAEVARVLRPGGYLIIAETPNKYWPRDEHTTQLWFNHWLPERLAYGRACRSGKGVRDYVDKSIWPHSGWRGLGYFEMMSALPGFRLIPEDSRPRHRLFTRLGIPASIIDPYPIWILQKQ